MIEFHYVTEFELNNKDLFADWIDRLIDSERMNTGNINYIFCDDNYLLNINQQYLEHDTFTDIITFDYVDGNMIAGDIFISVERIKENAISFEVMFQEELLRVMAHGLLHLLGYKDKTKEAAEIMRAKENEKMKLFHVEQ